MIRRRWWIAALATLAALVTSFFVARSQPPVYRSSVTLEVTGRVDYSQIMAIDKLLRQLAARIATTGSAESVRQRTGLEAGADELLGKVHTQAFPDTMHIQIDVDDSVPESAERLAATFAAVAQERQSASMADVPAQDRVQLSSIDRPTPARLFAPQVRSLTLAGGLLGLLAGVILLVMLDYADESFRGTRDVERYLALPVLGVVPALPGLRTTTP